MLEKSCETCFYYKKYTNHEGCELPLDDTCKKHRYWKPKSREVVK